MSEVTKQDVLTALANVKSPDMASDIVSQKLISEIFISAGKVIFSINVRADQAENLEPLRIAAEKVVSDLPGVDKAIVALTAEKKAGNPSTQPATPRPPAGGTPPSASSGAGRSGGQQGGQPTRKAGVPGIDSIIAVASGKGGVGKSTTSVNLALALQKLGKKVGILDADIYGPSMPRMLGISGRPKATGRVLTPLEAFGLKVMSMGFLVEEETPMIWRGPMVISALTQMLREVEWGELDVLVVDMPPGTGDAQLTMAQQVPLAGAVIVSTPQDIALIDARKGLNMFRKVEVPILGIVENMSTFICPNCGERSDIFGHGGAEQEADKLEVPFLGGIPLHIDIRVNSDDGTPIVVSEPDSQHALTYAEIGKLVLDRLELEKAISGAGGPSIVFE